MAGRGVVISLTDSYRETSYGEPVRRSNRLSFRPSPTRTTSKRWSKRCWKRAARSPLDRHDCNCAAASLVVSLHIAPNQARRRCNRFQRHCRRRPRPRRRPLLLQWSRNLFEPSGRRPPRDIDRESKPSKRSRREISDRARSRLSTAQYRHPRCRAESFCRARISRWCSDAARHATVRALPTLGKTRSARRHAQGLIHRGGLRAEIVVGGIIRVGDRICHGGRLERWARFCHDRSGTDRLSLRRQSSMPLGTLLNKQASGHATFTWLVAVLSAVFYAPATITIIEIWRLKFSFVEVGMIAGSAALHTAISSFSIKAIAPAIVAGLSLGTRHWAAACRPSRQLFFSASGRHCSPWRVCC